MPVADFGQRAGRAQASFLGMSHAAGSVSPPWGLGLGLEGLLHMPALTVRGALAGPWKAPWVLSSPGHSVASAGFRGPSALSAHPMGTAGLGPEGRSGTC